MLRASGISGLALHKIRLCTQCNTQWLLGVTSLLRACCHAIKISQISITNTFMRIALNSKCTSNLLAGNQPASRNYFGTVPELQLSGGKIEQKILCLGLHLHKL